MCAKRKHSLNQRAPQRVVAAIAAAALGGVSFASAESADAPEPAPMGGVALGAAQGGVADEAYIVAPPNYLYVTATTRGDFLDCGEAFEARRTDAAGRDAAPLSCGVTLTETIVIPAASQSARLMVHF